MCGGFLDDAFDFIGDTIGGFGKSLEGALSGNFGNILSLASLIPGPQQPFLLGANALNQFSEDNPLGGVMSGLGAAGGFGALGDAAGGIAGATDGFTTGGTALGDTAGLSGAWNTIGTGSDTLGDFLTTLPSNRLAGSGITGGTTGIGNALDTVNSGSLYDAFGLGGSAGMAANALKTSPLTQAIGGLAKAYGGYTDWRDAQRARKAYAKNVAELQNLYSPDSAYAQEARKRITRRDAARGRLSQYGSRETELAALLADKQASTLASSGYANQLGASQMKNAGLGGLLSGLTTGVSGLAGLF